MEMVNRSFILKTDSFRYFMQKFERCYEDISNDPIIAFFAVVLRPENKDQVIIRFVISEGESWDDWMEQAYAIRFLEETKSVVKSIETEHQEIIKCSPGGGVWWTEDMV